MIQKLLPIENLVFHSALNQETLLAQLQNKIETPKPFKFGVANNSYSKKYIGTIHNNRFEIKRVITYRNSFLPLIKGEIKNDNNGSEINVKMSLNKIVQVFMSIWLSVVSVACFGILFGLIFKNIFKIEPSFFILIPFFMLVFGVLMVSFGFKLESKKSIHDLEEILKARNITVD